MGWFLVLIAILIIITLVVLANKNKSTTDIEVSNYSSELSNNESIKPAILSVAKQTELEIKEEKNDKKKIKNIEFKVAGVTKENEKGKDIQEILKRVANQYKKEYELESFNGMTNKEIIEDYLSNLGEFEGQYLFDKIKLIIDVNNKYDENAIKIYLMDPEGIEHHVGFVKRDSNKILKYEILHNTIKTTSVEFTGGKYKTVDYDFEKDKDVVTTEELTRGLYINVAFENEIGAIIQK